MNVGEGFRTGSGASSQQEMHLPEAEAGGSWNSWKDKARTLRERLRRSGSGTSATSGDNKDGLNLANVVVGPVIGKVTDSTARILIELDRTAQVTLSLVEEISGVLAGSKVVIVPGFQPTVFAFQGLRPGTAYAVQLRGCEIPVTGGFRAGYEQFSSGFRTIGRAPRNVKFAVISCNKIFITRTEVNPKGDLWHHLAKMITRGQVDMMLHLGDQVYADGDKDFDKAAAQRQTSLSNKFTVAERMLENVPPDQWPLYYDRVCAIYREIYRETWAHPPTRKCLANCPSLMIYDDHEVRDNWGDLPGDWDPTKVHMFIARCAWRVQAEYQRQLHEDVDFSRVDSINRDFHFHVVGGVGLMFLDIRGSRSFHRVPNDRYRYLGTDQWTELKSALGRGGIFDGVRALLVCSPAPVVFLTGSVTDEFADRIGRLEDFKGHWSHRDHKSEQLEFLTRLVEWKARGTAACDRELYIFGGDVHCGGHTDVLLGDQLVLRQLTSSAIANHPLPSTAYSVLRLAGETLLGLGDGFRFDHHHWTRKRNYGLVDVGNHNSHLEAGGQAAGVEITTQLVKGHDLFARESELVTSRDAMLAKSGFWTKAWCFAKGKTPRDLQRSASAQPGNMQGAYVG